MRGSTILKACLCLLAYAFAITQAPGAAKRIYIAPDDHTDYMWSGDEDDYRQAFVEMLDYHLDLIDSTASEVSEHQSRWNCDGHLWLWTYENEKSPADFDRLITRIRDGHVSVPLNCLVPAYGGTPLEGIVRGMLYPGTIERQYDLRFPMAVAMENQTLPYGLGAIFAGAGAKYSWRGICDCATKVTDAGDREHDIYWWEGPDGSRILMKWNTLHGSNQSIGGYAEARNPTDAVNFVDTDAGFIARYPFNIIGAFGHGWDNLKTFTPSFVSTAKSETTVDRTVIVSNEIDFFEDFEVAHGASIPTESRAYGNEWELYNASMAEVSASVRRAVERLRAAEAMASLVTLYQPDFMDSLAAQRDNAWIRLGMYWDHSWTADSSVISRSTRAAWQRQIAGEIADYADALETQAADALATLIDDQGRSDCYFVFNPLGWTRTDCADLPADPADPFHVVDVESGQEVPSQRVTIDSADAVRILAEDVPAAGYRLFAIVPGAAAAQEPAVTYNAGVAENDFYRLTIASRGAIESLEDLKAGGRQWAQQIGNRYLNDLGAGTGSLSLINDGPVSATILAQSASPLNHTSAITLYRDIDRVEIENRITQNFSDVRTWSFSFNAASPDVRHEEIGAVIRARLTNGGGHYSPRNARYDWLTMNHFADVSDGAQGMTISNADCAYMRLGASSPSFLDTATPQIHVLAGGQVDGANYGIPAQGGDDQFLQRFALKTRSETFDPAESMRFALEHQNPLLARAAGPGEALADATAASIAISNPNVLLWAMKPAEDGPEEGLVVRLWNLSSTAENAAIRFPGRNITAARSATHIETPLQDLTIASDAIEDQFAPQQIKTYLVNLEAEEQPPSTAARLLEYP